MNNLNNLNNLNHHIINLAIVLLFSSCGVYNSASYLSADAINIIEDENRVELDFDCRNYEFNIASLLLKFYEDQRLPVVNKNREDYITQEIESISTDKLKQWDREASALIRRYANGIESIAFTIPGRMVVCLSRKESLYDCKPAPNIVFSITNSEPLPQYDYYTMRDHSNYYAINYTRRELRELTLVKQWDMVLRRVVHDRWHKRLVVIDYIPIKNSEYIFTLIYPISGKPCYGVDGDGAFTYTTVFEPLWSVKDGCMPYQQINKECDPVSLSLSSSNIKQR